MKEKITKKVSIIKDKHIILRLVGAEYQKFYIYYCAL